MSVIAWTEFRCGPVEARETELAQELVAKRADFTESHAATAAELFNESGRRRGSLIDCMIAATALGDNAPLATANPGDFGRLETSGLRVLATSSARG